MNVVFYQVYVSATSRSLVQSSPTECGVSGCDLETLEVRRPGPNLGCCRTGGGRRGRRSLKRGGHLEDGIRRLDDDDNNKQTRKCG